MDRVKLSDRLPNIQLPEIGVLVAVIGITFPGQDVPGVCENGDLQVIAMK